MTLLTTQNPISIIQITDTHLCGSPAGTLLEMNTEESLATVIELIKQKHSNIDLLLATGDIAQDASAEAYNKFFQAASRLDTPLRWVPGNHDDAAIMERVAEGRDAGSKLVQINNWLIVLLDSSLVDHTYGALSPSELEFLQATLSQAEDDSSIDHCLICLHHNPIPGIPAWMSELGLQNSQEFFETLAQSSKSRCVIYGHIHHELDFVHQGIRCFCSPSTCIQFKPDVMHFELDKLNPGYRYLTLMADGAIESGIERVPGDLFEADYNSPGYE